MGVGFMKLKQTSEELSNVNLLIFLLVQFPEIFTINYNLIKSSIKLTFMLRLDIGQERYISFKKELNECLKAYIKLAALNEVLPKLSKKMVHSWTLLQVTLNKDNISFEEVNLISSLVLNEFKNDVILDIRNDSCLEKEISEREEFIEYLLSSNKANEEEIYLLLGNLEKYMFLINR
jgi:hypothetical protein